MTSLSQQCADLLIVGISGPTLSDDAREVVKNLGVGGIILFRRNVQTPEQTHALIAELRACRTAPLLLSVDQEGGRVQRLRAPLSEFPPMRAFGSTGDASLVRELGAQLAHEVSAVGFDLNFAPVVDVDSNPNNPVIGDRSFGRTPDEVSAMAVALIEGMQSAGVYACAKHFPGHGDTHEDSHQTLPSLAHDLSRLRQIEWPPFVAAAKAGVASLMTAHVMFPAIDAEWPATLSKPCLDFIRSDIGYDGVVISDDLEMKAIAERYDVPDAAVRAIDSGCDALLVCHTLDRMQRSHEALVKRAEKDSAFAARVQQAHRRVSKLLHGVKPMSERYIPATPPGGALGAFMAAQQKKALLDPTEVDPKANAKETLG